MRIAVLLTLKGGKSRLRRRTSSPFTQCSDCSQLGPTYAAAASQPVFEGGALRDNLRYAKSEERQALISYQQTIQRAFGDVSDSWIGYDKHHSVRERQERSMKDLQESVNVSLMRYKGGTATYLSVLDSQRSLFVAELTLAQARDNEYQGLVQLFKILGGGWK